MIFIGLIAIYIQGVSLLPDDVMFQKRVLSTTNVLALGVDRPGRPMAVSLKENQKFFLRRRNAIYIKSIVRSRSKSLNFADYGVGLKFNPQRTRSIPKVLISDLPFR